MDESILPDLPIYEKGGKLALHEHHPELVHLEAALSWESRPSDPPLDLDISAFLLKEDDKVRHDLDFIFYNNRRSLCRSVQHLGDERTGDKEGDDEVIAIDLSQIPENVIKITLCASIHKGEERRQSFRNIQNAAVRLLDRDRALDMASYDLQVKDSAATAFIFGELYKTKLMTELPPTKEAAEQVNLTGWQFRMIGQGDEGGLGAIAKEFGVNL